MSDNKVIQIIFCKKDGTQYIIDDRTSIAKVLLAMPEKIVFKKTTNIATLRNKYFAMLQELRMASKTGYTKATFNEQIKPLIFKKFNDFTHYFTTGVPEYSTRNLTLEGWQETIEQLKDVANDVFGYVFEKA